jgi:hypothetical protein
MLKQKPIYNRILLISDTKLAIEEETDKGKGII